MSNYPCDCGWNSKLELPWDEPEVFEEEDNNEEEDIMSVSESFNEYGNTGGMSFNDVFYSPDEWVASARPELLEDSETRHLVVEARLAREKLLTHLEGKL